MAALPCSSMDEVKLSVHRYFGEGFTRAPIESWGSDALTLYTMRLTIHVMMQCTHRCIDLFATLDSVSCTSTVFSSAASHQRESRELPASVQDKGQNNFLLWEILAQ